MPRLNAISAQRRNIQLAHQRGNPCDAVVRRCFRVACEHAGDLRVAQQGRALRGAFPKRIDIRTHPMRQHRRADRSVRRVEHAADGRGKAVYHAQSRIRQCHSAEQARVRHPHARLGVTAIRTHPRQTLRGHAQAIETNRIGKRIGAA